MRLRTGIIYSVLYSARLALAANIRVRELGERFSTFRVSGHFRLVKKRSHLD
jgi:hypothetical protein